MCMSLCRSNRAFCLIRAPTRGACSDRSAIELGVPDQVDLALIRGSLLLSARRTLPRLQSRPSGQSLPEVPSERPIRRIQELLEDLTIVIGPSATLHQARRRTQLTCQRSSRAAG